MKWWNNYQIQLEFIKKYNNQDQKDPSEAKM